MENSGSFFVVENGGNSCYIDSLLMALFYTPSYMEGILKKKLKKEENTYIQEYIYQIFVTKVRDGKSVSAEEINNLRVVLTQSGWLDWDTILEQQDVNEFYAFLSNILEFTPIELEKKIYTNMDTETIQTEKLPFIPLSLPYDVINKKKIKNTVRVPDMLRNWLHLDEVDLKRGNEDSKGLSTYLISNMPEFLFLSINRFPTPEIRNDTDVIITKTLKPYLNSPNNEMKGIEWIFHSAVCHKGSTPRTGHYYSLLFNKEDEKWYIFDDLVVPSLIEVTMDDNSIVSEIKKDCIFFVYQLKF